MSRTQREEDILKLLAAKTHIGAKEINFPMRKYVTCKTSVETHVFNLEDTYQKIRLAAWIIASVPNLAEVIVVSGKASGQRAIFKFSQLVGTLSNSSSRWIPGTLTNQNTLKFKEPRLLVVTDPKDDKQAIIEASYVNIPCIALCNTDAQLDYIDVVIPCNNRDTKSISMVYWLLAREVLTLRGKLEKGKDLPVMVDLFFFRDADAIKPEEKEEAKEGGDEEKKWDDDNEALE